MKYFIVAILICQTIAIVKSEHCGQTGIRYLPKEGYRCEDIEGGTPINLGQPNITPNCEITVCGDGNWHPGSYCGKGPCNIFGNNCDGGCHQGDAYKNFKRNYRNKLYKNSARLA